MARSSLFGALALAGAFTLAGCVKEDTDAGTVDSLGAVSPAADSSDATVARDTTPARPDAQMQAVLDELAMLGGKPIATLTPGEARRQPTPTDAVMSVLRKQGKPTTPEPGVTATDRTIPGPAGPLPVRIYTPTEGSAPYPVVVYFHGGGWVIGSKEVYDGGARGLAKRTGAIVVSVDYRLGPEHKFPAAHDDAVATYKWAVANARSIRGDSTRMALAGESAGGGLAVATAIAARDQQLMMPKHVLSVYPIAGADTTTPSYTQHAMAKPLNRAMMTWFFEHYLRGAADRQDPRVNLVAANLRGLPPMTIINAGIDPLLSDGEMLAQRLRDAGVTVEQRTFDGVTHEFFGMAAVVDRAKDAQQMGADGLKRGLGM